MYRHLNRHLHSNLRSSQQCYQQQQLCSFSNNVQSGKYDHESDFVIIGAGSAGCVLANRLSKDSNNQVHVLEAGSEDKSWRFHMPAALMYTLTDPVVNWCYWTTPQKHVNNRSMYWPRAKVWGGCSSHNAMVYIRGHAFDYDRWEKEGAEGWSYADCLPYFKKSEHFNMGADDYRGAGGLMGVTKGKQDRPLFRAFIEAGQQAGYPYTDDINGYQQEGFGSFDMTIEGGTRCNTSGGYLQPALYRTNLAITSNVLVTRLLFEGKKAVGVEYMQHGTTKKIRANKEVILSAGAINSPQLLMLSGVGDDKHLKEMDIPTHHHLPGVGQNLQDHLELYVQQECTQPITLYKYQWKFPHNMVKTGLEWFWNKTGPASTAHMEVGAFIRSRAGVEHPDIQFHFLPSVVIDHGQGLGNCHAYQLHVGPMRPTSRGEVKLRSKNPEHHPLLDANYLATEQDRQEFRDCIRLAKEIFAQKAFDPFRGKEIQPGVDFTSDAEMDAFVRDKSDSAYHPSCTCKMGGANDKMAVVDSECRVYGLDSLRIIDASIMPSIVSGNLNGPTVMLAEKAADIILGQKLPKSNAPVYRPATVQTQR